MTPQAQWDLFQMMQAEIAALDESVDADAVSLPTGAWSTVDSGIWQQARNRVPSIPDDDEDMTYENGW